MMTTLSCAAQADGGVFAKSAAFVWVIAQTDPALQGRDLGPWFMLPAWFSVPCAIVLAGVLCWYFVRLGVSSTGSANTGSASTGSASTGNPDSGGAGVSRALRWVRRLGILCALAAIGPLLRAVTFVHPHEQRVEWATAWSLAILALFACFLLAIVDVILVLRGGLREYSDLRREVFGGGRRSREDAQDPPKDKQRA